MSIFVTTRRLLELFENMHLPNDIERFERMIEKDFLKLKKQIIFVQS